MQRILVATDFSSTGDHAIQVALGWARRTGAALRIVHVVPPRKWLLGSLEPDPRAVSGVHRRAAAALKRRVEAIDPSHQLEISTGVISGAASSAIVRSAREFGAELLVVGARGEHDSAMQPPSLGGTSLKLVSRPSMPLLLVRNERAANPACVLAAVDLSPVSKDVLAWSRKSVAAGGRIVVFHAYEIPFANRNAIYGIGGDSAELYSDDEHRKRESELDALIAPLRDEVNVTGQVERGDAIDALFRHIQELDPDLIVLGRHGRRRRDKDWSGSVSRHTALFAPTNVLIVPPS